MWKSGSNPHEERILSVEKIVDGFFVFHRKRNHFSFHNGILTFPQKNVENYSRSLELILDVISRTIMMVL